MNPTSNAPSTPPQSPLREEFKEQPPEIIRSTSSAALRALQSLPRPKRPSSPYNGPHEPKYLKLNVFLFPDSTQSNTPVLTEPLPIFNSLLSPGSRRPAPPQTFFESPASSQHIPQSSPLFNFRHPSLSSTNSSSSAIQKPVFSKTSLIAPPHFDKARPGAAGCYGNTHYFRDLTDDPYALEAERLSEVKSLQIQWNGNPHTLEKGKLLSEAGQHHLVHQLTSNVPEFQNCLLKLIKPKILHTNSKKGVLDIAAITILHYLELKEHAFPVAPFLNLDPLIDLHKDFLKSQLATTKARDSVSPIMHTFVQENLNPYYLIIKKAEEKSELEFWPQDKPFDRNNPPEEWKTLKSLFAQAYHLDISADLSRSNYLMYEGKRVLIDVREHLEEQDHNGKHFPILLRGDDGLLRTFTNNPDLLDYLNPESNDCSTSSGASSSADCVPVDNQVNG